MKITKKQLINIINASLRESKIAQGILDKGVDQIPSGASGGNELEGAISKFQEVVDTLSEAGAIAKTSFTVADLGALGTNSSMRRIILTIARNATPIVSILKSPLFTALTMGAQTVSVVLGAYALLPIAISKTLENMGTVEGAVDRQLKLKRSSDELPKDYALEITDFAKSFEDRSYLKRVGGMDGRDDVLRVLAMDILSEKGKNISNRMLQKGKISKKFHGEVLKVRNKLKAETQPTLNDYHARLKELKNAPDQADIKNKAIAINAVCSVFSLLGFEVELGPVSISADTIVDKLAGVVNVEV
jgi:hypothetical protein